MSKNKRYLRLFLAVIVLPLLLFTSSCKSRKLAQGESSGPATAKPMEDRSVQELLEKLELNSFKAQWMNAKANVSTVKDGNETSFNINMRYKRDSVIWISISPLLGIEVARVMVTPDSIKFLDRLHGKYKVSSFESINKLLQLKVNFDIVQSLLVGNFFAYKKNENRFNSVYIEEKYYILSSLNKKQLKRSLEEKDPNKPVIQDVYVNDDNFRITRVQVDDQKINKTLVTEYSDFRETNAGVFPFKSHTKVSADNTVEIRIEFGKINAGDPQEFPFSIPANYERVH